MEKLGIVFRKKSMPSTEPVILRSVDGCFNQNLGKPCFRYNGLMKRLKSPSESKLAFFNEIDNHDVNTKNDDTEYQQCHH